MQLAPHQIVPPICFVFKYFLPEGLTATITRSWRVDATYVKIKRRVRSTIGRRGSTSATSFGTKNAWWRRKPLSAGLSKQIHILLRPGTI